MATSVFKCSGCKQYFPKSELHRSSGTQSFHSQECLDSYSAKKPAKRGPRRSVGTSIPPQVREEVTKRDRGRCRYCNTRSRTHIHHIIYRSGGGKHVAENLITLCADHHDLVHSDKERFQPLCQGVVWMFYSTGRLMRIPEYERWIERMERDGE